MLENIVPSGYTGGVRDLFGLSGIFPDSSKDEIDETSLFNRFSDNESDDEMRALHGRKGRSRMRGDSSNSKGSDSENAINKSRSSRAFSAFISDLAVTDTDEDDIDEDDIDEDDDDDETEDFDENDELGLEGSDEDELYTSIKEITPAAKEAHRDFRRNFSNNEIPKAEVLYKAYTCALSKEILYQGRMFVTAHYICFVAKIFNVTTTKLMIPFSTVTKIEPKMMMNFIPNSIAIHTNDDKRYFFASFTNRNRTIEILRKMRNTRQTHSSPAAQNGNRSSDEGQGDGQGSSNGGDESPLRPFPFRIRSSTLSIKEGSNRLSSLSIDQASPITRSQSGLSLKNSSNSSKPHLPRTQSGMTERQAKAPRRTMSSARSVHKSGSDSGTSSNYKEWSLSNLSPKEHAKTSLPEPDEKEKVLSTETIEAPLSVVANTIFGKDSTWYKHFLTEVEQNIDLRDLPPFLSFSEGEERNFSYTKLLNSAVGPKQTKCNCTEKIIKWDLENYIEVITTTSTPDVPSGSSFTTLTRAVMSWDSNNHTQIRLGTWLNWTGKSWLKGPIEKGAIDGQTSYCSSLISEISKKVGTGGKQRSPDEDSGHIKPAAVESESVESKQKSAKKLASTQKATEAIKEWQQLCMILSIIAVMLFILLLLVWFRSPKASASPSHEQQSNLIRLQQELEMWQWIDDRKKPLVQHRKTLTEANIEEAIILTEKKLASLKASLY